MKPLERTNLIQAIALKLQAEYKTVQINSYLRQYKLPVENVTMVPSKRLYVEELLESVSEVTLISIAKELGISTATPAANHSELAHIMEMLSVEYAQKAFHDALDTIDSSPDEAIGKAATLLESICKVILDKLRIEYPSDQSIQPLYASVAKAMDLSPDAQADPEIKRVLGGLMNAAQGIGALRTQYGAVHGKGKRNYRLAARHAKLAVAAASALGLFLFETFNERIEKKTAISEPVRRDCINIILALTTTFHGRLALLEFLNKIWDLKKMPSKDSRYENAEGDIWQHMINNSDIDEETLLIDYLGLLFCTDEVFLKFVELVLDPLVFVGTAEQKDLLISQLNENIGGDGFQLVPAGPVARQTVEARRVRLRE